MIIPKARRVNIRNMGLRKPILFNRFLSGIRQCKQTSYAGTRSPLRGELRPFVDAGIAFFQSLSKNNTVTVDEFYDNAHHVSNTDLFNGGFKSFQAGLTGGAGLRYKRFGLEYKFESISNIGSYGGASVRVNGQKVMLFFNLKN